MRNGRPLRNWQQMTSASALLKSSGEDEIQILTLTRTNSKRNTTSALLMQTNTSLLEFRVGKVIVGASGSCMASQMNVRLIRWVAHMTGPATRVEVRPPHIHLRPGSIAISLALVLESRLNSLIQRPAVN